jgi:hypothetical protein
MQKIAINVLFAMAFLVGVVGYIVMICTVPVLANIMIKIGIFSGIIGVILYLFEFLLIVLPVGLFIYIIRSR